MRTRIAVLATIALYVTSCAEPASSPSTAGTPTGQETSGASNSAAPTARPSAAEARHVATVLVDGLTVRSEPGPNAPAVPCDAGGEVLLTSGAVVWLVDEAPVDVDGASWQHVVVNATLCHEIPTLPGWVARGPNEDPSLGPVYCPDAPSDLEGLSGLARQPLLALGCFSGEPLTVEGFYPTIPEGIGFTCSGIEPTWLTCSLETISSGADGFEIRARVPPSVAMPARGNRIVVTGHFDDPAAATCLAADIAYVSEVQAIFYCRTQFVIDTAQLAP